jgi:hypothetical protein
LHNLFHRINSNSDTYFINRNQILHMHFRGCKHMPHGVVMIQNDQNNVMLFLFILFIKKPTQCCVLAIHVTLIFCVLSVPYLHCSLSFMSVTILSQSPEVLSHAFSICLCCSHDHSYPNCKLKCLYIPAVSLVQH